MTDLDKKSYQEITERITLLHSEALVNIKTGIDKAIEIGGLLTHAKKKIIPFGQFGDFCRDLPFSERTCQNYMKAYDNRTLIKNANIADLASFFKFLKTSLTPSTANSEEQTAIESSGVSIENKKATVSIAAPVVSQEQTSAIAINPSSDESSSEDYSQWHKNQTKTNSINNKATELCLALERQPLESIDLEDQQLLNDNLKLVFKKIFSFIANGTNDNDGNKTEIMLIKWIAEAKDNFHSEKSKAELRKENATENTPVQEGEVI